MTNPRLADRYAKSLIDIAVEKGQLEEVYADAQRIIQVCKKSREFEVMLKSPVIKGDKKAAVINALSKGNITEISRLFLNLLVHKGREYFLREIMQAFCERYDIIKGISRINLTTAIPVTDEVHDLIVKKLQNETKLTNITLKTKVDESLIGGFVLEFNNYLVDRSVKRFLKEVKVLFGKNEYIYNIR
jgi:F-type H+-transporting ATPase subunit delta